LAAWAKLRCTRLARATISTWSRSWSCSGTTSTVVWNYVDEIHDGRFV
jgi:hypothetical protein